MASPRTSSPPSARPPASRAANRAFRDPVTITLDGEPIRCERGEPIAVALIAAGRLVVARSPKFHRPRSPACMRAACDGCLARVDETPNVMTCMVAAKEGTAVVTQNRLGPRENDLLRMTDWFFPDGMNHHELFAGVPGIQTVMQAFARRVAGLGRLPTEIETPHAAARRDADVMVVGAGPSGMAIATALAAKGRAVEVIDDQLVAGGSMRGLAGASSDPFAEIRASFTDLVSSRKISLRTSTVAGGMYGDDLLVVGEEGAEVVTVKALVLATGAHDGALAFEGNDVPGIMSARAAGILHGHGVLVGKKIVVVVPEGGGPFGDAYARAVPSATLVRGEPVRVRGSMRAKSVTVRASDGKETEHACDAVVIDAPRAPAYELAEQAGASLRHEARGFVAEKSRIANGIYAVGELAGTPLDASAMVAEAEHVTAMIQSEGTSAKTAP